MSPESGDMLGKVVVFSLIQTKCKFCGKDALLDEADKRVGKVYYERTFVCPDQHKTVLKDGKPGNESSVPGGEPCALERFNRFLDELEARPNA